MNINRVETSGNLVDKPVFKETLGGSKLCTFTLCTHDRVKDKETGEYIDKPNFVACEYFGGHTERLCEMLEKGDKIYIAGRLHWDAWETKDGEKRSKLVVRVDEVDIPPIIHD